MYLLAELSPIYLNHSWSTDATYACLVIEGRSEIELLERKQRKIFFNATMQYWVLNIIPMLEIIVHELLK